MKGPDADTLMFFNEHPQALPLYEHLEKILFEGFPDVSKRVQKTQITFSNRHVFACVSFAKVKRKAGVRTRIWWSHWDCRTRWNPVASR